MSQSIKLDNVVTSLVATAPPGELKGVQQDLTSIIPGEERLINASIEEFINAKGGIFSNKYIASKLNKLPGSSKYIDFINKQLFNIDVNHQKAIDIENYTPDITYPSYFNDLVTKLETYGKDHYPSNYAFTIIPKANDEVYILIIGEKLNHENYYTGQWNASYLIKNGKISGDIKVDIHYYEDGNVRLNFDEHIDDTDITSDCHKIINFINNAENKLTLKIVDNFNDLNVKYFKNLRRLLPVTRSKINWGNAIGNYRLGSDVVHKK